MDYKLVIAGWGCFNYFKSKPRKDWVVLFDSPNHNDLMSLMADIDIAVQLMRYNFGESSGIVPMLLSLNKNVIVSKLGSFLDFGNAVEYVAADASIEEIAHVISNVVNNDSNYKEIQIKEYVLSHSVQEFTYRLRKLVV